MATLLEFRERLKTFYSKYESYVLTLLRVIYAFIVFLVIEKNTGYIESLSNVWFFMAAALVCGLLSSGAITIVACVIIIVELSGVSSEAAILAGVLVLVMYFLYFSLFPKKSTYMTVMLVLCFFKIPGVLMILAGLLFDIMIVFPIAFGAVLYVYLDFVKNNASLISTNGALSVVQKVITLLGGTFKSEILFLLIITTFATIIAVYIIKRTQINNAGTIAVLSGTAANLLIMIIGKYMLNVNISLLSIILGAVLGLIAGIGLSNYVFPLDYSRVEKIQFEDDEYYYYVKAVPKMNIAVKNSSLSKMDKDGNGELIEVEDIGAESLDNLGTGIGAEDLANIKLKTQEIKPQNPTSSLDIIFNKKYKNNTGTEKLDENGQSHSYNDFEDSLSDDKG